MTEVKVIDIKCPLVGKVLVDYRVGYTVGPSYISQVLNLDVGPHRTVASMNVTECIAATPQEAMDKLADWLEGLALTIRKREKPISEIPVHG